jgi:hypothetical protein
MHIFHWTISFTHSTTRGSKVKFRCQTWIRLWPLIDHYSKHAIVSIQWNFIKHNMKRTSINLFTQLTFNWGNERMCIFHV